MRLIAWEVVPAESRVGLSVSPAGGEQKPPTGGGRSDTHAERQLFRGEERTSCAAVCWLKEETHSRSQRCSAAEVGHNKAQKYLFSSQHLHTENIDFPLFTLEIYCGYLCVWKWLKDINYGQSDSLDIDWSHLMHRCAFDRFWLMHLCNSVLIC